MGVSLMHCRATVWIAVAVALLGSQSCAFVVQQPASRLASGPFRRSLPPACALPRAKPRFTPLWALSASDKSNIADVSRQSELARARKLLEDSRSAFAESRSTRAKVMGFGSDWGLNVTRTRDLHAEFR